MQSPPPEPPTRRRFLVELRRTELGWGRLQAVAEQVRAATRRAREDGEDVAFLRTVYVPEDGTLFLLCEGTSVEAVRAIATTAGVVPAVVSSAVSPGTDQESEGVDR